jgi:glucose/mannose-6-phosphate isomerase
MSPLDTAGLRRAIDALPELLAADLAARGPVAGLPVHDDIDSVLLLGTGTCGEAADAAVAIAGAFSAVPLVASRDYELPGFVGDGTLVVALCVDGEDDEVIEAATEAVHAGGRLVAVTRGGRLADVAHGAGAPVVTIGEPSLPASASFTAAALPVFLILEQVGLFAGGRAYLADAIAQLARRRDDERRTGAIAGLARTIGSTWLLVYGGSPLGAAAARHWKAQVNRFAKAPSFAAALPALCHDEVAGWGQHGDVSRQVLTLVRLRHDFEHPLVGERFELLGGLLDEVVAASLDVTASGEDPLAQLFDLVYQGDLLGIELAARAGVDPGPLPAVDALTTGR